jgi:hypothetical protein
MGETKKIPLEEYREMMKKTLDEKEFNLWMQNTFPKLKVNSEATVATNSKATVIVRESKKEIREELISILIEFLNSIDCEAHIKSAALSHVYYIVKPRIAKVKDAVDKSVEEGDKNE